MVDKEFVNQRVVKGREAVKKVEDHFFHLSSVQLTWKPSADSWSIAECLDHLIISNRSYFDELNKIIEGTYKMSWWQKNSPLTRFWGKTLRDQLQETVKRKMTAPAKLTPSATEQPADIVNRYCATAHTFLDLIDRCRGVDIDKVVITSPTIRIVTYNLRDAFEFLISHEHRHINQAIRVKQSELFPKV